MSISLPQKVTIKKINDNTSQIIIGPCHPGYGITLGNALKRVLLSSLKGGAVYGIKIKGIQHEFSAIPGVLEDVIEIILNLKELNFNIYSDEEIKITLEAKGKGEIKGKDIKLSSDVELINKDTHIATLTSAKAELKMDIFIKNGRGYWPVEEREDDDIIGFIAIDSFFGPVEKVGLKIENTRVEKITNYENIILDIKTNGVITPEEAVKMSNNILLEQFNTINNYLAENKKIKKIDKPENLKNKEKKKKKTIKKEVKKTKEEKKNRKETKK